MVGLGEVFSSSLPFVGESCKTRPEPSRQTASGFARRLFRFAFGLREAGHDLPPEVEILRVGPAGIVGDRYERGIFVMPLSMASTDAEV